jgi:transcriptional accessory protein Tex/SPT6
MNEEIKKFDNRVQAIKELYPNAKIFRDNSAFTEDETEITLDETTISNKVSEIETAQANEKNQKATDKANGNQKLLDLGLSQAEATALTGYTPPSED